jgi:tungstate transport system substrate-binding protein
MAFVGACLCFAARTRNSGSNIRRNARHGVVSSLTWCFAGVQLLAQPSPTTVRLATVMVPASSGLLDDLLAEFERQSGYQVQVYVTNQDIYDVARTGAADLVISHYGFPGVVPFVLEGLGQWPRPIFASQAVVLGPPEDPAHIRGMTDVVEAFHQIAETQSPFIANNDPNVKVLVDVMWEAAGRPDRSGWYVDSGLEGSDAVDLASSAGGYTVWGIDPFLQYGAGHPLSLEVLLANDPFLQRIMVSIIVTPKTSPSVNILGATALQEYLVSAAAQARVRAYRYPGFSQQFWWPAAQHGVPPGKVTDDGLRVVK